MPMHTVTFPLLYFVKVDLNQATWSCIC